MLQRRPFPQGAHNYRHKRAWWGGHCQSGLFHFCFICPHIPSCDSEPSTLLDRTAHGLDGGITLNSFREFLDDIVYKWVHIYIYICGCKCFCHGFCLDLNSARQRSLTYTVISLTAFSIHFLTQSFLNVFARKNISKFFSSIAHILYLSNASDFFISLLNLCVGFSTVQLTTMSSITSLTPSSPHHLHHFHHQLHHFHRPIINEQMENHRRLPLQSQRCYRIPVHTLGWSHQYLGQRNAVC